MADKIGILGSGDVGRALATGFARHGWDVLVGTRSPDELAAWAEEAGVAAGSFADAAGYGDVAVLAVRGDAVEDVLDLAGAERFTGTLVLDATNPLDFSTGDAHLLFGGTDSLGERVQATLADAYVVKCFNTVSNAQMVDPEFEAETPPMFICGDHTDAKAKTAEILADLGWPEVRDVGDIRSARYLEALVPLWVRLAGDLETYGHAFTVVQ
ncbi:NADPH-dependent F420 reductase [Halorarius litoreus]|uniref:NADPH-dependent F420 reductase n=1 Tax=Halorarius litoreus TaxID=2962676 RepID=UPI0020CD68DB|nr:NAD(P)-binding domain-containing protein [Halorarius litoreus]